MKKLSPFRYFRTSPEVIRLALMMQVRFPLPLRQVEGSSSGESTSPCKPLQLQRWFFLVPFRHEQPTSLSQRHPGRPNERHAAHRSQLSCPWHRTACERHHRSPFNARGGPGAERGVTPRQNGPHGRGAEPHAAAAWLPLPYPLPACRGALPDRDAGHGRGPTRAFRRLPRARACARTGPRARQRGIDDHASQRDSPRRGKVSTTLIKDAAWVIPWDAATKRQIYRRDKLA